MLSLFKDLMMDVVEEMSKTVGLELDRFQIRVDADPYIEVLITAADPLDCVELAAHVISWLKEKKYEPSVLILP